MVTWPQVAGTDIAVYSVPHSRTRPTGTLHCTRSTWGESYHVGYQNHRLTRGSYQARLKWLTWSKCQFDELCYMGVWGDSHLRKTLREIGTNGSVFRLFMSTMAPSKRRPPDLDHCVQVLLRLQNLAANQTPKLLGEIYVCGLGLLYHLKIDRKSIQSLRCVFRLQKLRIE